jgi:guanine deaminase
MQTDYLQQAIDLATENSRSGLGGPYGAVIVRDGQILVSSANLVTKNNDPTAHAEIVAIRSACSRLNSFQLTDCVLYSSCEPCPMCLGAIYWARLKAVYYACDRYDAANSGFDDGFIYDEIQMTPAQRKIPMLQVNMTDAQKPFQAWQKSQEKIIY